MYSSHFQIPEEHGLILRSPAFGQGYLLFSSFHKNSHLCELFVDAWELRSVCWPGSSWLEFGHIICYLLNRRYKYHQCIGIANGEVTVSSKASYVLDIEVSALLYARWSAMWDCINSSLCALDKKDEPPDNDLFSPHPGLEGWTTGTWGRFSFWLTYTVEEWLFPTLTWAAIPIYCVLIIALLSLGPGGQKRVEINTKQHACDHH